MGEFSVTETQSSPEITVFGTTAEEQHVLREIRSEVTTVGKDSCFTFIFGRMILETDGNVIAGKVATHSMDDGAPLAEQTISQALATARDHLARSLLR
ncbi:hypothetical protein Vadar_032065 [Vaccinium darrowii]|uniref:Uncharacterized protein n=1 Tax=Vaccinium darrowii TaxID=229202 RepID=A0ACB7ZQC0_9ERIC|nr:hypothetical protein Vadar_032065 [Vaccinium darrowii]